MLLPVTVTGRVSDIWRSYITDRLLWLIGYHVAFTPSFVQQLRNPHSYMTDFQDEHGLYDKSDALLQLLGNWKPVVDTLPKAYLNLIKLLAEKGFLGEKDVEMAKAWVADLETAGYYWPPLQPQQYAFNWRKETVVDGRQDRALPATATAPAAAAPAAAAAAAPQAVDIFQEPRRRAALINHQAACDPADANIIVGVLTIPKNRAARDASRREFSAFDVAKTCNMKVYYLLDRIIDLGSERTDDIIWLNSTWTGKADHFGEKLYIYFKTALQRSPKAEYIVKMDDDVVICWDDVIARFNAYSPQQRQFLYMGHLHEPVDKPIGYGTRMDEQFVLVGRTLIERIAARHYCGKARCDPTEKHGLVDTNFGGTSLGVLLSSYNNDIVRIADKAQIHGQKYGPKMTYSYHYLRGVYGEKFCGNMLEFHKASLIEQTMFTRHVSMVGQGPVQPVCFVHVPTADAPGIHLLFHLNVDYRFASERMAEFKKCWSFAVARSPWERVAAFYSRCRSGEDLVPEQACAQAKDTDFNVWLQGVLSTAFPDALKWMTTPAGDFIVDYIVKYDKVNSLVSALRFHHPERAQRIPLGFPKENPPKIALPTFSEDNKDLMRSWFQREIKYFVWPEP